MTVPKTILFATDFSGRCDRPRERATQLAREWGARLIVLHVLSESASDTETLENENIARMHAKLGKEVGAGEIEVVTCLAFGNVAEGILEASTGVAADLIVMGISRHDEIGDFVVGTTVERVVRNGSAPTLVVKERVGPHYSNLLVGTDFSDCSMVALQAAFDLFPAAKITLLHAYQVRLDALRARDGPARDRQAEIAFDLEAFLDKAHLPGDAGDRLEISVDYGDVCRVAGDHAQTSGTDLTVIGTRPFWPRRRCLGKHGASPYGVSRLRLSPCPAKLPREICSRRVRGSRPCLSGCENMMPERAARLSSRESPWVNVSLVAGIMGAERMGVRFYGPGAGTGRSAYGQSQPFQLVRLRLIRARHPDCGSALIGRRAAPPPISLSD